MNIRRCVYQGQPGEKLGSSGFKHEYDKDSKKQHKHWADLQKAVHKECDSIELNISI